MQKVCQSWTKVTNLFVFCPKEDRTVKVDQICPSLPISDPAGAARVWAEIIGIMTGVQITSDQCPSSRGPSLGWDHPDNDWSSNAIVRPTAVKVCQIGRIIDNFYTQLLGVYMYVSRYKYKFCPWYICQPWLSLSLRISICTIPKKFVLYLWNVPQIHSREEKD
jgi:hypothetical protein